MKIVNHITELIGDTPIMRLKTPALKNNSEIFLKLEFFNPAGSIKDRVALQMVEVAEKEGSLLPGSLIIEATSGNTGIGLAMIAAAKGYSCQIVMPENMSVERQRLIRAYGAKVILTPAEKGMAGAIEKAESLLKENPKSFAPRQFNNQANVLAHYQRTGPEIWDQMQGDFQAVVAGVGTGGTITGLGKYFKEKEANIKVVGVEPAACPFISKGEKGTHRIQGIGAGFLPPILDLKKIDQILTVTDEAALAMVKKLGEQEGLFLGISAGAALVAAFDLAEQMSPNSKIVVIVPDNGEKYLSTDIFKD